MGHGNMIKPHVWMRPHNMDGNHIGCGVLDLPHTEFEDVRHHEPDCLNYWYSNDVRIPGSPSIPDHMSQPEVKCIGQAGHNEHEHPLEFPWWAPGTAPVYGSCGTLGGIPAGCHGDYSGKFGDCCSDHCDGFALGLNAEEYEWEDIPVTRWAAGSVQEVQWYVSANHAGGYSYRLCKMPEGGLIDLSEECFQKNQLDFVGDDQWTIYANPGHEDDHREEVKAKRTTEGTFPPGSMWTANPVYPHQEEGGDKDRGHGHIVDLVKVPNHLEPGEYVLGFRWDSKCSPQVWTSCANIEIY